MESSLSVLAKENSVRGKTEALCRSVIRGFCQCAHGHVISFSKDVWGLPRKPPTIDNLRKGAVFILKVFHCHSLSNC